MRMRSSVVLVTVAALTLAAQPQDYFVIDQQSGDENSFTEGGTPLGAGFAVAQSFTPALSSVDFTRLKLANPRGGPVLPEYVEVYLRSDAIDGPILATSQLEAVPDAFHGYVVFRFQGAVPVTAGTTYFIEARHEGEGALYWDWDFRLDYAGGIAYRGAPWPESDYWFQEGIVVPEPTTGALLLVGLGALGAARWFRREGQRGSYLV